MGSEMATPMDRTEERELVERAKRGDLAAHERIYREHSGMAFSAARRLLVEPDLAEEVVQDTFVDVIRKIDSYRGDAPLGAWIRRIAVNRALMFLRSYWHKHGQLAEEDALERYQGGEAPAPVAEGSDLAEALDELSPVARTVVWLYDVEGYTHAEIAALMGRTVSFSKSQLARAHARLRELLHGYGATEVERGTR